MNTILLKDIEEFVLPFYQTLLRTGSTKGLNLNKAKIQFIYESIYGYRYDEGCPACIIDAMKLIYNTYTLHTKKVSPELELVKDVFKDIEPEKVIQRQPRKRIGQTERIPATDIQKGETEPHD